MAGASTFPSCEDAAASSYALARLPRHGAGRVHSVFATSLNIAFPDLLLHLGPVSAGLSCLGATLPPQLLDVLLEASTAGDEVRLAKGRMRVYDRRGVTMFDLDDLAVRDCSIVTLGGQQRAWLTALLGQMGLQERCGLSTFGCLGDVVASLSCGLGRPEALRQCAHYLLGRGPGLTPSGDDVLVGYAVALWMGGEGARVRSFLSSLDLARTTDVSAAYLGAAEVGEANLAYRELEHALIVGNAAEAWQCLQELLQVGHSSGADGLVGLELGLRALRNARDTRGLVA